MRALLLSYGLGADWLKRSAGTDEVSWVDFVTDATAARAAESAAAKLAAWGNYYTPHRIVGESNIPRYLDDRRKSRVHACSLSAGLAICLR